MIGYLTRKLPSPEGVAAGATATFRIPIGFTYHRIFINRGTMINSDIGEIRLVINGETVAVYKDAATLLMMNAFDGKQTPSSELLEIDLERYNLRTRDAQLITAIATGADKPDSPNAVRTFSVEIDIKAGASNVSLSAYALMSPARPSGIIRYVRKFTRTVTGAGLFEIADIPTANNIINRVFFVKTSGAGDIKEIELTRDNFTLFKRSASLNNDIQKNGVRVPQSDVYVIDPTEDGFGSESILTNGINDLRFTLDCDGALNIDLYVEYLSLTGAFSQL